MKTFKNLYNKITSVDSLFLAWEEFRRDKRARTDVLEFERDLEPNIFQLNRELEDGTYRHGPYTGFYITDPKRRHVHKASVRDRIVHHSLFNVLNPVFEPTFIATSFSCQIGKGSHKGVEALSEMLRKESRNSTRVCYALKCDIRKFFDSVDHEILISMLAKRTRDESTMNLIENLVGSYSVKSGIYERERERERERESSGASRRRGIPIGNLSSQLFANIYMNEFDQYVKHILKVKYYVRYTDDFVIVSRDKGYLQNLLPDLQKFLNKTLLLDIHPNKISIKKYKQGVDFLGYVILPYCTLIRKRTWRRILRKSREKIMAYKRGEISDATLNQSLQSYLGVLSHANSHDLCNYLMNQLITY